MRGLSLTILLTIGLAIGCGPAANPGDGTGDSASEPEIRLPPRDTSSFDCQDIPEDGKCEGDVALYCDRRSSTIVSKRCGARSLSCEVSEKGARCVDSQGQEEEVPAEVDGPISANDTGADCDVYDYIGDCEDNTFMYCTKRNTLYVEDCGEMNATCGFSEAAGYYGCLPPPECNAEGDTCEGNSIKTCTIGSDGWEIDLWECDPGTACKDWGGSASCEDIVPATCEDLGTDGKCIDANGQASEYQTSAWAYCDNGEIVKTQCTGGQVCGDPDGFGWVECIDP